MTTPTEPQPTLDPSLNPLIDLQQSAVELAAFAETTSLAAQDLAERSTAQLIATARGCQPDPRPLHRDHHRVVVMLEHLIRAEVVFCRALRVYAVDLSTQPPVSAPVALNQPLVLVSRLVDAASSVHRACSGGNRRIDQLGRGIHALADTLLREAQDRPLTDEHLADLDTQIVELTQRHADLGVTLRALVATRDALRPTPPRQTPPEPDDDTPAETPAAESLPPVDPTLADAEQGEQGVL
jgi:hypothetical protein